ncbi:MAG: DUF6492 family protein [Lachnospiraceae bacterium]|nr:DUF6492 family protein [Lachnospiraceae bacterium]
MNQTKDLLLKIRTAVAEGKLSSAEVPVADMKQCVRIELEMHQNTFTEQQYEEILNRFNELDAGIEEGEVDKGKILLFIDVLILCTDMISEVVYRLIDKDYWRYKHGKEADNPEIAGIIEYIGREHRIDPISYDFVKEYNELPVTVCLDGECGMYYIPYKGRRMFFPKGWDQEKIVRYYRSVIMEQDERSPHCYADETFGVKAGDVVVDVGAAEGIFALNCIDIVSKLYIIEADAAWIPALEQTFRDDGEKVQFICGFLDSYHDGSHVSIDGLFAQEEINYIKMDIEGAEKEALLGAKKTLERCKNIRCAICAYHCRGDEEGIQSILTGYGFETKTSKGYMCPSWTLEAYLDAELRRGIVFGRKTDSFDALIMVTAKDFTRVQSQYHRLAANLPARHIFFVGNEEVARLVRNAGLGEKVGFLDENAVLPFDTVHEVMKEALKDVLDGQELPRGITGWYYQQFLKMQYARMCEDAYYLVWDGDTIPCAPFSMFREGTGTPYLDMKQEYCSKYFDTMEKLVPDLHKCFEKSFISEHMLMNSEIMRSLLSEIESNTALAGKSFWEKIIHAIDVKGLQENSFSEFETYGTYVAMRCPEQYRMRDWHSFRYGGVFYSLETISDTDYAWLSKDFSAISFEKGDTVREDQKNLFDNRKYQEKLSARQMLEIAQQEFKEGSYLEKWE